MRAEHALRVICALTGHEEHIQPLQIFNGEETDPFREQLFARWCRRCGEGKGTYWGIPE